MRLACQVNIKVSDLYSPQLCRILNGQNEYLNFLGVNGSGNKCPLEDMQTLLFSVKLNFKILSQYKCKPNSTLLIFCKYICVFPELDVHLGES